MSVLGQRRGSVISRSFPMVRQASISVAQFETRMSLLFRAGVRSEFSVDFSGANSLPEY